MCAARLAFNSQRNVLDVPLNAEIPPPSLYERIAGRVLEAFVDRF